MRDWAMFFDQMNPFGYPDRKAMRFDDLGMVPRPQFAHTGGGGQMFQSPMVHTGGPGPMYHMPFMTGGPNPSTQMHAQTGGSLPPMPYARGGGLAAMFMRRGGRY